MQALYEGRHEPSKHRTFGDTQAPELEAGTLLPLLSTVTPGVTTLVHSPMVARQAPFGHKTLSEAGHVVPVRQAARLVAQL